MALKLGEGKTFIATAGDISGEVRGIVSGSNIKMEYTIILPEEAGGHILSITDWLYLTQNGVIMNKSELRNSASRLQSSLPQYALTTPHSNEHGLSKHERSNRMIKNTPLLAIGVGVATVAFALSPFLIRDFAGYRPEQFPVVLDFWPAQPAGWAFSIWGVIYVWLIAGAIWGGFNAPRDRQWQKMRVPLLASVGLGIFWIAAANAAPILATVMIFAMVVFAIIAMLRAGDDDRVWQVRPVALYAGWLTAANGVGASVVLSGYGVLTAQQSALAMLAIVLLAALAVQSRRPAEWAYPAAIIWALAGVIAANIPSGNWPIIALSAIGITALAIFFVLRRHFSACGQSS